MINSSVVIHIRMDLEGDMITSEQLIRYEQLLKEKKELQKKTGKNVKVTYIISVVLGLIIGIVISYFGIFSRGSKDTDTFIFHFYIGAIAFSISFVIHIILHEGGHLVFGLLTGYKFLSFRIFSTIFYKNKSKIKVKKYSIKGTAGQCLMYPPKQRSDGSFPFILYNMGGGMSNLFFSLVMIPPVITSHGILRTIYIAFITAGVLFAITNLVPFNQGLQNDGMNLKGMLRSKELLEAFYVQLKVNAQMSDGKLITEYAPSDFPLIEGRDSTNMLAAFAYFYSYYMKLSAHDYEGARQLLDRMAENAENYLPANYNLIELERLFFMVIERRPIEEIACVYHYVRVILNTAKTSVSIQRVSYVYESLLSEVDKKDIMILITKKVPKKWKVFSEAQAYENFLKTADNFPVAGEAAMHLEIVEYIRNNYITNNA